VKSFQVVRKELESSQQSEQKLKTELKQLRDSMVGVRAVQHEWHPESMDVIVVIPESETTTHPSKWYWQEDESRLGSHNKQDIHQPGNFVAFSGSVTAEIEEAYMMFLNFRAYNFEEPPTSCKLNLVDRIASTGTEQKAYAPESGYDYEINFLAMTQTNLKSGFVRKVFRREMSPPTPPTTSFDSCASKMPQDKPAELIDEDCLVLYQGQLVQTSRQREDGWAYGSVVFDPEPERTPIIMEGISSTSGWFPINCSALPTNAQLRGWQAAMGGHGADVLAPPIYWEQLKDPLVAQLYPVNGTELGKVSKFFLHTLTNVKIHEVSRIQSVSLWQSYAAKRQTVVQREMSTQGLSEQTAIRGWSVNGSSTEQLQKSCPRLFSKVSIGVSVEEMPLPLAKVCTSLVTHLTAAAGSILLLIQVASRTCFSAALLWASSVVEREMLSHRMCVLVINCMMRQWTMRLIPASMSPTMMLRRTQSTWLDSRSEVWSISIC